MRIRPFISSTMLLCVLLVGGSPAASLADASTGPPPARIPQFQAVIDAYQRDYPSLTDDQAARAAEGQEHRLRLLEGLQAQNPDGFGGSWYDPLTNIQHINAVGATAATLAGRLGTAHDLNVVTHQVTHSFAELQAVSAVINAGKHPLLGSTAVGAAAPDIRTNRVTVTLPVSDLDRLRADNAALSSLIVLKQGDTRATVPDVCYTRLSCTSPLRSGIVLWATRPGNHTCSLGFTARAGDGSRWAVTAGHCGAVTGEFGIWGHGQTPIGPIQAGRDYHNIDIARIQVSSAWQTGGYLYDFFQPNIPAALHYAITARGTIQHGDAVCLSAWHSTAANCGTIVQPFGPRGMAQVSFDACNGDSGGGWFYVNHNGERWAYGIHHGQAYNADTCHDHARNDSTFTTVPDMNAFWDATTASRLRLEER
jgi:streptogrisin C